jgi:excisionase family DNA binding protein
VKAALAAAEQLEANHDAALEQWRLAVERARYEAQRVERRYRVVEPENRLVARGLEAEWEQRLRELEQAEAELKRRAVERPKTLNVDERKTLLAFGNDLQRVWQTPTTTHRDRKELLHTLIEEVIVTVFRDDKRAHLTLRWRGGLLTEVDVDLPRSRPATVRTDEDTIELVRRLATHYPDTVIAGILNRQGRTTATGLRFTANLVGNLRRHWKIPRFESLAESPEGELVNVRQAATILGIAPSTLHRWLNDGFVAGEQITSGAPWQIRLTEELRNRFVEQAPDGYVTMQEATKRLGVSRQTVLQCVKNGKLDAVHVYRGRRKGLRIKVIDDQSDLFNPPS